MSGNDAIIASGERADLRPLAEGDAAVLTAWLPAAVALAQGRRSPAAQDEAAAELAAPPIPEDSEGERVEGVQPSSLFLLPSSPSLVVVERDSGEPIGLLAYRAGHPEAAWVTVRFLAIAPERRGRGLGGEAALAFEEAAARRGWGRRFCVAVHPDNGLSLYFWLRVGYRPARSSDFAPGRLADGCLWMVRLNM